jgi:hypothetical protein
MKFRPKRRKVNLLDQIVETDNDDPSDNELNEETRQFNEFGPSRSLDPSPPSQRQKVVNCHRDVLRLNLHHGDILIQQGAGLQKYYEVLSSWSKLTIARCDTIGNENCRNGPVYRCRHRRIEQWLSISRSCRVSTHVSEFVRADAATS